MKRKGFFIAILMALCTMVHGQNVPENIVYTQIYDFVDELVMCGVVDMNTAIRPYSRGEIAKALQQARQSNTLTTSRRRIWIFTVAHTIWNLGKISKIVA